MRHPGMRGMVTGFGVKFRLVLAVVTAAVSLAQNGTNMCFGAALTDASLMLASQLQDKDLLTCLEPLQHIRFSLGPSDYSPFHYDWGPGYEQEIDFVTSMKIPQLKRILSLRPDLEVYAAPWQPPRRYLKQESMDQSPSFVDDQALLRYGKHLASVVMAWQDHGVTINYLSVQNEPLNYNKKLPLSFMYMDAQTQADLAVTIHQELRRLGSESQILLHDHNPDPDGIRTALQVAELCNKETPGLFAGFAFHTYAESVENIRQIKDAYPDLSIHHTEISSSTEITSAASWSQKQDSRNWHLERIKGLEDLGCETYTYWNLFLDFHHGPKISSDNDSYEAAPLVWVMGHNYWTDTVLWDLFKEIRG